MTTFILGGTQSDFAARFTDDGGDIHSLLGSTVVRALETSQVPSIDIEVAHIGNLAAEIFVSQAQLGGSLVSIDPTWYGLPTTRHEAACASGSVAALAAIADIEAGHYDVALVVGVEVMRNVSGEEAGRNLGCAAWYGREAVDERYPWPHLFARVADAYEDRYGIKYDHLARIARNNYESAKLNPMAQTRDWNMADGMFAEDDAVNPKIAGMLRKTDCGRITDGAAAIVIAGRKYAETYARKHGLSIDDIPQIKGWGHATGPLLLDDKLKVQDEYVFPHVRRCITDAYRRAQVSGPQDLDLVETHDCFSITEYVGIDHFGLVEPGRVGDAIDGGMIDLDGSLPFNPSGGLIGLGHPVGATGVRMLLDASRQVSGQAGAMQVDNARNAATLNIGGSFTTAVTFVVGV